jgi:hypothetical protein
MYIDGVCVIDSVRFREGLYYYVGNAADDR